MQQFAGMTNREYFRKKVIKPLLDNGKLKMTIPDKPKSIKQKYVKA
jgi:ATP-dependent DNA helicase RecG